MTLPVIFLVIFVLGYLFAALCKLSIELNLLIATILTAIAAVCARVIPALDFFRHLVEGTFTYLDVLLLFVTGGIFMMILQEGGATDYIVHAVIKYTGKHRTIALLLLALLMLIPGALTGAGSISLLVLGAPVAAALSYLGVPSDRAAAMLFVLGGLSAAAPPVNIWAMITCAGTAIPYVGFELTLAIPIIGLAAFTALYLGRKTKTQPVQNSTQVPVASKKVHWWQILLPFLTFFGLIIAGRVWPFSMPALGLPLVFAISAVVAWLCFLQSVRIVSLCLTTIRRLLPLLAVIVLVGMIQQVLTATGVRGLISYAVLALPLVAIYVVLPFIIPFSEAVLTYGGAAVLGIPLAWFLDSVGQHATVVIAGLSLLWLLGDGLPPTALIGRLSMMATGYNGPYRRMLRAAIIPWIVITLVGISMVVFSRKFVFLVTWST
jgi:TRAP-type C4-dicarboxylate transport system permease large subunit